MKYFKVFFILAVFCIPESPSWAQSLICCSQLVDVNGKWVGAGRGCKGYLEEHPEKRELVCDGLLKSNSLCAEIKDFCKLCSGKDGDASYLPDDPIVKSIINGFHAQGIPIGPEHILVQPDKNGGYDKFTVRLDAQGCVLPDGQCVMEAGEKGYLPEGKQETAFRHIYGSVLTVGSQTRVKTRTVNIETGVIMSTGQGDAGPGEKGVSDATAGALNKMGMACKQVKDLIL
jgi:hypothetical protein